MIIRKWNGMECIWVREMNEKEWNGMKLSKLDWMFKNIGIERNENE